MFSKIVSHTLFIFLLLAYVSPTFAANFTVAPLLVDVEAQQRDAFVHEITLTSHHTAHQRLFASVHEITVGDNSEIKAFIPSSMSDRSVSVTSWIEVTRSRLDLQPDESVTVPLTIRVNHDTPPGLYHAFIGFAPGTNRDEAEAAVMAGQGLGVVIRIAVGGTEEEFLRLVAFTADRFSMQPNTGFFTYTLENTGDVPLNPEGDIIIYDSRGRELTSVQLESATDTSVLAPGETREYVQTVPYIEQLGRFKAFLSVEYGTKNRAAVYDTNFYYSIPWYYIAVIAGLLITLLLVLILLARRTSGGAVYYEHDGAEDLPLYVGRVREHNEYEHDIDLKKKNTTDF